MELDDESVPAKVVKTAFDEEGALSLKREHEGITWYDSRIKPETPTVISFSDYNDRSCRLESKYRKGNCGDLKLPVSKNYKKIYNALNHYLEVFRKEGALFSHGDYSIDNILFDKDEVTWILDWENFNKDLPCDFDAIYCVMEALYFNYKMRSKLTRNDVFAATKLLKYGIDRLCMPDKGIVNRPASYIRRLFLEHKDVFSGQIMKYPFMNCSPDDILALDAIF